MKKYWLILIILIIAFLAIISTVNASWLSDFIFGKQQNLSATICYPNQGCTGTSTKPTYGKVLVGNANGNYDVVSTSTLGISGVGAETDPVWVAASGDYLLTANAFTQAKASTTFVDRADWTTIDDYPTACGAGQYISALGDTSTCGTPAAGSGGGLNIAGNDLAVIGSIPYFHTTATTTALATSTIMINSDSSVSIGTGTEIMTIVNNNVGIGTTSPYSKLSVVGNIVATSFIATGTATSTLAGGLQANALNIVSTSASSTFANGINLSSGCFAIGSTCIGGSTYTTFGTDFFTYFSATTTDKLTQGSTNKYWSNLLWAGQLAGTTTDALAQGSTNKYYTDALVDSHLSGGTGVTYTTGAISFDCSEVEGTGIDCSGENITLNNTGAWAGTYIDFGKDFYTYFNATTTDALTEGSSNLYLTEDNWSTFLAGTTTDALPEGATNLYNYTHTGDVTGATGLTIAADAVHDSMIDWGTGANQVSTADITEQTNLFYTDARVNAYIHASSTIPKTYTTNTFNLLQTLGSASTTKLTIDELYDSNGSQGGNGEVLSSTVTGTDWVAAGGTGTVTNIATTWPIIGGTITTTGTLSFGGLSTSTAAVSGNIPYFSGVNTFANTATTTLTGTAPIVFSNPIYVLGASASAVSCTAATASVAGCLAAADFTIFNNKIGSSSLSAIWPLAYNSTTGKITSATSSDSSAGVLSSTDWASFNNKIGSSSLDSIAELNALLAGTEEVASSTGNASIVTVGTIGTGSWHATTIDVDHGGTGSTTLTGILKGAGTGAMATAVNGTDYTLLTAQSCTNQVITALTAAGGSTCSSVSNAMLSNSTISGVALGANLAALTNDATLSGSSYNGSGAISDWGLNLANPNTWTALQQFSNATSTNLSATYASSTLGNIGTLTLPNLADAAGKFIAINGTGQVIATTTPTGGSGLTSVGIITPVGMSVSGSPLTVNGSMTLAYNIQQTYIPFGGAGGIIATSTSLTFNPTGSLFTTVNASTTNISFIYASSTTAFVAGGQIQGFQSLAFDYATTTAWTGTSTLKWAGTALAAETLLGVQCSTNVGTVVVLIGSGSASTSVAITTANTYTNFASPISISALDKRFYQFGTPATLPTYANCTIKKKY